MLRSVTMTRASYCDKESIPHISFLSKNLSNPLMSQIFGDPHNNHPGSVQGCARSMVMVESGFAKCYYPGSCHINCRLWEM